nr:capsid protein [Cressdnaviricota sp.]
MARRRYYRRAPRVVVARKKWATCMKQGVINPTTTATGKEGYATLAINTPQTSVPTPVVVKAGNFKIQGDCFISVTSTGNLIDPAFQTILYVMYLPEAFNSVVGTGGIAGIIDAHPEWIMAWKVVDTNVGNTGTSNSNSFSFSSRLKRNLNSGDTIALVVVVSNTGSPVSVSVKYAAQYWTSAN